MSDTDTTVRLNVNDEVATVTVDRKPVMNAVNVETLEKLETVLREAADRARVLVLTGAGDDAFICGADIDEFHGQSARWFESEFREAMRGVEDAIERCKHPVIASVNGVSLGGGTEIALMCDLIIADEDATFGLPEIGLGLIPGCGGTQRLSHLVGVLKAKELILTGKHVSAQEAVEIGLANEVVEQGTLEDRVDDLAGELASGPHLAQWYAKKAINHTRDIETGLELEAAHAALLYETSDTQEGLAAFLEKREPEFE